MGRHHDEHSVDPAHARQVFRLPLTSDPLLWWTGGVAFFFLVAVWSSDEPDPDIPPFLDGLLAAIVMGFLFGVVPALIRLSLTRRKLGRLPHLARVAPVEVAEQLQRSGPFPLAVAVKPDDGTPSADERLHWILDTAQTAGVCVSTYLLALAHHQGIGLHTNEPALQSLRRSMTEPGVPFDSWMPLCVPLLDEVWTGSDGRLATALRTLDTDRREQWGTLPVGTSAGDLERSGRALDRVLRMATLLVGSGWLLVDEVLPRPDGQFAVTAVAATGDDPDLPLVLEVVGLDAMLTGGGVAARGPDDEWLHLDPLIVHRLTANGQRLMYFFENFQTDGFVTYRSFSNGSTIVVPDRADDLHRLALQIFGT